MKFNFSILLIIVLFYSCTQNKYQKTTTVKEPATTNIDTVIANGEKSDTASNSDYCAYMKDAANLSDSILDSEIDVEERNLFDVNRQDSSVSIRFTIPLNHRIFGFEKPDVNSKRLILYSSMICDVDKNPFHCPLGSYVGTNNEDSPILKYQEDHDTFVEMIAISKDGKTTRIYIKREWVIYTD